jgi:hypothetical protein
MFVLFATKPLNDGTKGFRFNFAGVKGLTRKRKTLSRGFKVNTTKCMTGVHFGKRTIYIERKLNRNTERKLCHFAG